MNNMLKLIKRHSKKVTSKPPDQRPKWNCRKKEECPMEGNCQVKNIVYKCEVTKPFPKNVYLGLAEGELKSPLNTKDILTRRHFQVTYGT